MTTQTDIIAAIEASADESVRIIQGAGEDRECGNAFLAADGSVSVSWDSGVRTKLYGDDAELV